MQKNTKINTDSEKISRKSKASPKKKLISKRMSDGKIRTRGHCSKLMALQDALQDPVKNCEGL